MDGLANNARLPAVLSLSAERTRVALELPFQVQARPWLSTTSWEGNKVCVLTCSWLRRSPHFLSLLLCYHSWEELDHPSCWFPSPWLGVPGGSFPAHSCPALGETDSGKPVGNESRIMQPIFFLCNHGPKQRWRGCACPCSYLTVPMPLALARVRCLCFAGRGFRGLVMGGTFWGPYTPLPHFSPSHSTLLKRKDQLSP